MGWLRSSHRATPATGSTSSWPTSAPRRAPAERALAAFPARSPACSGVPARLPRIRANGHPLTCPSSHAMTLPAATYDLVMLLDPEAEEATRAKLVADARAAIEAQGEFLRHDEWGNRALSYPIERRNVAEYHLLQFHAHTPALLGTLDRSLRIADDILRFRIIKLKPGVPDAPDMLASPSAPRRAEPGADGASGGPG